MFLEIGDSYGAEIVKNSCVGCLAHLARLCHFIGHSEPSTKPQMDTICDWSLEQLGDLTEGMNYDEYTYFDLLLKVRRPSQVFKKMTEPPRVRFRGKGR